MKKSGLGEWRENSPLPLWVESVSWVCYDLQVEEKGYGREWQFIVRVRRFSSEMPVPTTYPCHAMSCNVCMRVYLYMYGSHLRRSRWLLRNRGQISADVGAGFPILKSVPIFYFFLKSFIFSAENYLPFDHPSNLFIIKINYLYKFFLYWMVFHLFHGLLR